MVTNRFAFTAAWAGSILNYEKPEALHDNEAKEEGKE
jgi:hypothetical protein